MFLEGKRERMKARSYLHALSCGVCMSEYKKIGTRMLKQLQHSNIILEERNKAWAEIAWPVKS